jgi:hypothetical protein
MIERSDISSPMWRKKVDASLLNEGSTPIPNWLVETWNISKCFAEVRSKKSPEAVVEVIFKGKKFDGRVVKVQREGGYRYRLYIEQHLDSLRKTFLMTYMRTLEGALTEDKNRNDVEEQIPFWEFIDIEFKFESKQFHLTAHYTQKPWFPELFKRLVSSAPMRAIQDEISGKKIARIQKLGWSPRQQFNKEINAVNVIYTLIDTTNKLIYVGEAVDLIRRFSAGHKEIPDWDFYKFNLLPDELAEHRLAIERMSIRDMAALLENKNEIGTFSISDYKLANKKIDK